VVEKRKWLVDDVSKTTIEGSESKGDIKTPKARPHSSKLAP